MSTLAITLFGTMGAEIDGQALAPPLGPRSQELLAYLLIHRTRLHRRESLAGLLWGDRDEHSAKRCLSTALWRLRRAVEPDIVPPGSYIIATSQGEIGFNMQSDCYLDLDAFEASVALPQASDPVTLEADQVASLEQGIGLCRGEILEGFYSDWALRERERIREMRVVALHKLMEHYGQANCYHDAIRCARLILESDPLREDVHRRLILLCNAAGDRAGAVRQYRFCRELLRRELGVYPMPETEACFQMVLGDQAAPDKGGPRLASQDRDHLQKAVAALHESVHSMFTFARELEQLLARLQTHDR